MKFIEIVNSSGSRYMLNIARISTVVHWPNSRTPTEVFLTSKKSTSLEEKYEDFMERLKKLGAEVSEI